MENRKASSSPTPSEGTLTSSQSLASNRSKFSFKEKLRRTASFSAVEGAIRAAVGRLTEKMSANKDPSQSKLSQEQLTELQRSTHFDKKELQSWYKGMSSAACFSPLPPPQSRCLPSMSPPLQSHSFRLEAPAIYPFPQIYEAQAKSSLTK